MIQDGKLRGFAMGQAIAVRTDYTAGEVRRFAQRAKDAAQARRLLAIAAVLDGASREEAATIGGMDRQTLRDWVIRFNEQGADGLINIPSPGVPPKLNSRHKAFLARIVEEGPIAAIHGVVRWRACDLIMRLYEELSVSDDTIYRALKTLGFSHMSTRPNLRPTSRMLRPWTRSKKLRRACGGNPGEACTRHIGRGLGSRRDAGGPKEQAHLSLGQERFTPPCRPRSTDPIDLSVWCGLSRTWSRRRPRAAGLQLRSHAAPSRRDRNQSRPRSARHYPP